MLVCRWGSARPPPGDICAPSPALTDQSVPRRSNANRRSARPARGRQIPIGAYQHSTTSITPALARGRAASMFRDAPCLVLRDIEKLTRCSLRAIPVPSATPARAMARSRDRRHQACRGKHPRGRLQQAAEPPRRDSAAAYQHRIPARRTARCQFASGIPAPPVANQTWFGQTWFDRSPRRTARPHCCHTVRWCALDACSTESVTC